MWPGGSIADWEPAYDGDTGVPGLNPCNATNNYNNTGLSDAAYLVSPSRPQSLSSSETAVKNCSGLAARHLLVDSCRRAFCGATTRLRMAKSIFAAHKNAVRMNRLRREL